MVNSCLKADLAYLLRLQQQNISLRVDGEDLLCNAPEGALTPEIKKGILRHKTGLMRLLSSMEREGDLPCVTPHPENRFEPFPLTENQEAYWLGRSESLESGGVGVHVFFEIGIKDLDKNKLQKAWSAVVHRHDMLRAVILPEGKQRVLPVTEELFIEDEYLSGTSSEENERALDAARQEISHLCHSLFEWPQFKLKVFHFPKNDGGHRESVLMISIDTWSLDLRSMQIILDDLVALYNGWEPSPLPSASFRDYVLALQELHTTPVYEQALAYWRNRITTLPPAPSLPLRQNPEGVQKGHFTRRSKRLGKNLWNSISRRAKNKGLGAASVLLTCYASVLSKWSTTKHFTLNIPRYNRLPMHEDINNIVGEFASFSLLEVDNRNRLSFEALAKQIQHQLWADLEHTHVSGVRVLRDWKTSTGSAYPVMAPFVFTNEPEYDEEENVERQKRSWIGSMERLGTVRHVITQTPQVWLDSQYTEINGELYISWDSLDSMFEDGAMDAMFETYCDVVNSLGEEEGWQRTEVLPPASDAPLRAILTGPTDPLPVTTPWEALQKQADDNPEGMAVTDAVGTLTWKQVCEEVNLLIDKFRNLGLPAGEVFAFALPKGRKQFIASMAIHAFGGVVVPLDHESPETRLVSILSECRAAVLLADTASFPRLAGLPTPVLNLDAPDALLTRPLTLVSRRFADPLYCMIFTSGSTGVPKGVMMPLDGLLNMAQDAGKRFNIGKGDTLLSLNPIYHDFSLFDVMGASLLGMSLVFPDPARLKDPGHWLDLMQRHNVSVWATVPATMTMLLDYWAGCAKAGSLERLRYAIQGGDWIPLHTPVRLKAMAPNAQVVSIGGPTEVSVWNLLYPVEKVDSQWRSIPYGYPIRNAAYHILDDKLEDCPAMVTGEMYCSGAGLTAGYFNDEEKTAAAFFVHPTKKIRMFRTGDLGRLHPGGYIEIIGRRDNQVNVNGYRIELGEIESAARKHPSVSQAVAVVAKGPGGVDTLAVWVVCKPGCDVSSDDLKEHLKVLLPKYMLPPYAGVADHWPLTQNNKIDRQTIASWSLPEVGPEHGDKAATPSELELEAVWRELLGRDTIFLDQNFFEIGGNSITAVRLYNKVMAGLQGELSVATIFSCPTIRELARVLDSARENSAASDAKRSSKPSWPVIEPVTFRLPVAPATRSQQRIFYQDRDVQDSGSFNLSMQISVSAQEGQAVDAERLRGAFNTVVSHHEILRTTFRATDATERTGQITVLQQITPSLDLPLEVCDLSSTEISNQNDAADAFCREFTQRRYDLENGPLVRIALILESRAKGRMLIGFHHIVLDGWSIALLVNDFISALGGKPLTPNTLQQADIALWENTQSFARTAESMLPDAAQRLRELDSPSALPDAVSLNAGQGLPETADPVVEQSVPSEVMEAVSSMCSSTGCTPFAVLYTVFGLLTAEYNRSSSAQIGTYVAARTLPGLEKVMGSMVSPAPVLLDYDRNLSFLETVGKTMRVMSEAIDDALLPFEDLVKMAAPPRTGGHPFFSMAFSYDNTPTQPHDVGGMHLRPLGIKQFRTSIDFEAAVSLGEDNARMGIVFNPRKIRKKTTEDFMRRFFAMLGQAACNPEQPVGELSAMTSEDRQAIDSWNGFATGNCEDKSLTGLFLDVLRERPDAVAVIEVAITGTTPQEHARYTFAELGHLVESIASTMLAKGAGPYTPIVLPVTRSARFIAALIAAQLCGAVATPVPETMPEGEMRNILQTLGACLVCCDTRQEGAMTGYGKEMLFLDAVPMFDAGEQAELQTPKRLTSLPKGADVCLLFTSGSEGKPKGVRLTDANWVHRLKAGWAALPYEAHERCLVKTSTGFVDAFSEIFQPLLKGIPLHVVPGDEDNNVEALVHHTAHWRITRLTVVPSLLQAVLDYLRDSGMTLPFLKIVVSTGERLPLGLAKQFRKLLPHCELFNFYGSTEVTGDVICGPVTPEETSAVDRVIPIGRPMRYSKIEIVNHALNPLPPGIPGQLAVAGRCVTPGYADGTSAPFFTLEGERFFATGDLGMWTEDGELLCFGRLDRQIKIRGQRIEASSVEESIRSTGMVADAVVFALGEGPEQTLAACCVPVDGHCVTEENLRVAVRPLLSQAAMPSVFRSIPVVPKTRNGKTDLRALQSAVRESITLEKTVPLELRTETEKKLAGIWASLIGAPPRGRESDFFVCGGHSLAAARLATMLREQFNVSMRVKDIFDTPNFADQAELIDLLSAAGKKDDGNLASSALEVPS